MSYKDQQESFCLAYSYNDIRVSPFMQIQILDFHTAMLLLSSPGISSLMNELLENLGLLNMQPT